jgi:hypothetical protein
MPPAAFIKGHRLSRGDTVLPLRRFAAGGGLAIGDIPVAMHFAVFESVRWIAGT